MVNKYVLKTLQRTIGVYPSFQQSNHRLKNLSKDYLPHLYTRA